MNKMLIPPKILNGFHCPMHIPTVTSKSGTGQTIPFLKINGQKSFSFLHYAFKELHSFLQEVTTAGFGQGDFKITQFTYIFLKFGIQTSLRSVSDLLLQHFPYVQIN